MLRNRLKRNRFAAEANQKTIAISAIELENLDKAETERRNFRVPGDGQAAEIQPKDEEGEE